MTKKLDYSLVEFIKKVKFYLSDQCNILVMFYNNWFSHVKVAGKHCNLVDQIISFKNHYQLLNCKRIKPIKILIVSFSQWKKCHKKINPRICLVFMIVAIQYGKKIRCVCLKVLSVPCSMFVNFNVSPTREISCRHWTFW